MLRETERFEDTKGVIRRRTGNAIVTWLISLVQQELLILLEQFISCFCGDFVAQLL
jgi:hypothetical protein